MQLLFMPIGSLGFLGHIGLVNGIHNILMKTIRNLHQLTEVYNLVLGGLVVVVHA